MPHTCSRPRVELPGSSLTRSMRPAREAARGTCTRWGVSPRSIRTRRPHSRGDHWPREDVSISLIDIRYFATLSTKCQNWLVLWWSEGHGNQHNQSWWWALIHIASVEKPPLTMPHGFAIPKWCSWFSSSLGSLLNRLSTIHFTHSLLSTTWTPAPCSDSISSLYLSNKTQPAQYSEIPRWTTLHKCCHGTTQCREECICQAYINEINVIEGMGIEKILATCSTLAWTGSENSVAYTLRDGAWSLIPKKNYAQLLDLIILYVFVPTL